MPTIAIKPLNGRPTGLTLTAKIYTGSTLSASLSVTESPASSGRYVSSNFTSSAVAADYDGSFQDGNGNAYGVIRPFSTDAAGNLIDTLSAIKAKTDQIGSITVTYTGAVASDGSAEIIQGDDYLGTRALSWTKTNYSGPSLVSATVQCALIAQSDYQASTSAAAVLTVSGTVVLTTENDSSTTALFTVPLTATQTASLASTPPNDRCNYVGQIVAVDASGHRQTDFLVSVTVRRKVLA